MKRIILGAIFSLFVVVYFVSCSDDGNSEPPKDETIIPADGKVPQRQFLEQNWTDADREAFWFTSQGSQIMKYTWFTWLEQPDNQKYFRNTKHMEMLGYLPMKSSKMNPSGLPVGFTISADMEYNEAFVGLTCAACHTNQMDFDGKKYLIEGAPTLANFVLLYDRLSQAVNKTLEDDEKFTRFAAKVLGKEGVKDEAAVKNLKNELTNTATAITNRINVNALPADYPADYTSFGRLDAFGNIENAVTAFALNDLDNKNAPSAPVSYPFLWGTHQSNVVQWNGSANNRIPIVGPVSRNAGEVVGVFGSLSIEKPGKKLKYKATVDYHGIGVLEGYVKKLRSPRWPEAFPDVNEAQVEAGAKLYKTYCGTGESPDANKNPNNCHQVISYEDEGINYKANLTPIALLGTDEQMAVQIAQHKAKTLILDGVRKPLSTQTYGAEAPSIALVGQGVYGILKSNATAVIKAALLTEYVGRSSNSRDGTDPIAQVEEEMERRRKEVEKELKGSRADVDAEIDKRNADTIQTYIDAMPLTTPDLTKLHYKGRPLNGIWATAPYLHNGSVPNLWELLKKPSERTKTFWVGSFEFDAKNVGFITDKGKNEFKVLKAGGETIMPGNDNGGHNYGTLLSDEEKWALVEYMKTL